MTRLVSRLLAALAFVFIAAPALAQNYSVANHAIPLGRGTNVGAFNAISAAANTKFLVGGGTSADPVMATMSGDCSQAAGVVTCPKANGVSMPSSGTSGGVPYYSSTSAVSSSAALTANSQVLGGGAGAAPKTVAGITSDGVSKITLGVAGTSVGGVAFNNATSGSVTLQPVTGALGSVTLSLPAATDTLIGKATTDTLTNKTFDTAGTGNSFKINGTAITAVSGSGSVCLTTSCALVTPALGTPASGTLTNVSGLPISTGVSGLGTGIAAALAVNTGSAGAPVLFNGAGGTPSSLTLTNATGLPVSGITSSTSTAIGVGSVELGNASDTTLSRSAAGQLAVEGVDVITTSNTKTLSNKTLTAPVATGVTDNQGTLKLSSVVTSTQITTSQNDYTATDGTNTCSTKETLRLSSNASLNITGLSCGQAEGDLRILHNVGASNIVLTNQDTGSTAANRFLFGGDFTLLPDNSITIRYDATASRWRALVSPGAGGGGGGGVTSVAIAAGTGISTSGTCTITTSGTCTVAALSDNAINNCSFTTSVSSNALTIALKGIDGNDPSSTNPCSVQFRNVTVGTGTPAYLTVTAANSLVISSGSTTGFSSGTLGRLWIVGFNDGSTFRLGVVNCLSGTDIMSLRNGIASSTAEGGAGAADSTQTFYTGTAVTSKAFTVLGYLEATEATAGTWATAPSLVKIYQPGDPLPGDTVQVRRTSTGALATGTTTIPLDDTIPQNTEGNQYLSQAITPMSGADVLQISSQGVFATSALGFLAVALFQDSNANALKVVVQYDPVGDADLQMSITHAMQALSTSSTTFNLRAGQNNSGTTTFNGRSGGRLYGGTMASYIEVREVMG